MRIAFTSLVLVAALVPVPARAADDAFPLRFPQPDPATSFIDDYGFPRRGHRHQGVDLMGPKMTPVVAAADGFVERKARHRTGGYYLVIRHVGGWETHYMHLNDDSPGTDDGRGGERYAFAPGIEEGAFVHAGQLIGWVGDSGNAEWTAPHTHFELHRDGEVLNPYPFLVEAWRRFLIEWVSDPANPIR